MIGNDYKVIAVDFDNTLFETDYPAIVRPISPVIKYAKLMRERGAKLILWTCREGKELEEAVEACRAEGLLFDAVNDNLPEMKAEWGNNPRKVAADEYWDDRGAFYEAYHMGLIFFGTGEHIPVGRIDPDELKNLRPTEGEDG